MTKQEIKKYFVFGVIGIAVIVLSISLFTAFKNKGDNHYKELIKAKDETIQAVTRERDTERRLKDEAINELNKKDSLLQLKYKTNVVKYEKIPVYINSLDREGLRAAGERAAQ